MPSRSYGSEVGGDMRGCGRGVLGPCLQFVVATLLGACASALAQTAGTLTLAEGSVELIRGATLYSATQGVRLGEGDILSIDPKGQAQIEFQDGAILNLSQGARAMLTSIASGARGQSEIAVLSGWAKFTQKKSSKGAQYRYLTPRVEIDAGDATAVLNAGDGSTDIYVESGAVRFSEISRKGVQRIARDAKGGEFIVRRGEQPATLGPRPSAEFVKNMPRHFRDDLPVLLDRFKNRRSEPKREHEVTYAEVEAWLKAGFPMRKNFVKRFEIRSKDSEFRRKLIDNLREHPEWDKVLFPEKYEPKDPNSPKSRKSGAQQ
ncbi:MAG: FecR domain-containing protein [Betaproteobacteria bacterium]|nr:MAG: FecR domain-containing protein [Betaproteobacteria bacterium]TMH46899.1 MAG: FecR domain-containing protein [Betaproteobacteria bacterium]